MPRRVEPASTFLRLRLRARNVAVATRRPEDISSHNVLPATLAAVTPARPHEAFVTLRIGPTPVLARLTRDAVATLGLQPG